MSKRTRTALEGWRGDTLQTRETVGQMLQRVMPAPMGMKNIADLNDEAHLCFRMRLRGSVPPGRSPQISTRLNIFETTSRQRFA